MSIPAKYKDKEVLRGARYPLWGCPCGRNNNWRSRIRCSCGKVSPHVRDAIRAHEAVEQHQSEAGTGRKTYDARSKDTDWKSAKIARLERELEAAKGANSSSSAQTSGGKTYLEAAAGATHSSDQAEGGGKCGGKDIGALYQAYAMYAKQFGKDDDMALAAKKKWEDAKVEKSKAKPMGDQIKEVEWRLKKREEAKGKAEAKVAELATDLELLQKELEEAKGEVDRLAALAAEDAKTAKELHQQVAKGIDVSGEAKEENLADKVRAQGPNFAGLAKQIEEMLAREEVERKVAAEAAAAAADAARSSTAGDAPMGQTGNGGGDKRTIEELDEEDDFEELAKVLQEKEGLSLSAEQLGSVIKIRTQSLKKAKTAATSS